MESETDEDILVENEENNAENESIVVASTGFEKRKWPGWKEFSQIPRDKSKDGKLRALCLHCKTGSLIAESSYGTTNARNNLNNCKACKSTLPGEGKIIFQQKVYRELVAKAIIKHGYTFSWVEHDWNRKIHEYLCSEVKTICCNTAKADCLKLFSSLKVQLINTLRDVSGRICLTCDLWTSCQTEDYLCLTAHFIDANWKLNSVVLNFRHMESHSGLDVYNVVLELIKAWGIKKMIFSITLDNASSNDKMQDHLSATLKSWGCLVYGVKFFHIRCDAHVINLIVKEGLKVIDPIVIKIRHSVKHVKGSELKKIRFRKAVDQAGLKESKALWLDVPTRWNSTYMMLDRALLYRAAFDKLNLVDKTYIHCPHQYEWDMVEKIRDVLTPFNDITELFSGSDYPTANLYFENVWRIALLLKQLVHQQSHDEVLRAMAMEMEMQSKFDKYWADSKDDNYGTLFAFALILDPRCKLHFLKYCFKKLLGDELRARDKVDDIQIKLEMLLEEYKSCNTSTPSEAAEVPQIASNRKRKFDFCEDYDNEGIGTTSMRSKLLMYLEDDNMDRKTQLDVLEYWRKNENRYGELAHLARDILTVPLTTVASKSTFSIGGRLLNKWKSSYIPNNIEALITARSWMFRYEISNAEEEFIGKEVEWYKA